MIKFSDNINEISTALAKAQHELENADKKSTNPHFRSKYADLAEILNTVRPTMSKYGIAVSQHPAFSEGTVYVTTLMSHTSGQWIQSCVASPIGAKADSQALGSCVTYLRRYSLAAVCGIAQEDDDGNAASAKNAPAKASELDEAIVKSLKTAKDLKSLATAWGKIDVAIRHDYAGIKDECKAKLSEVGNG